MYYFLFLFILFIIYSFIGWIIEMIVCGIENKKIINRGFLVGPYCPIYGISSILMIFVLKKYMDDTLVLFVMAIFICTTAEYLTSYFMEKIFHARWWDYSNIPFNINGRVCLTNSMCFGFLGVLLLYFINPYITKYLGLIPKPLFYIFSISILIIFVSDVITSFNIIHRLKLTADSVRKDYTEEITTKVKEIIMNKSFLSRRLIKAFPNINFKLFNISRKR